MSESDTRTSHLPDTFVIGSWRVLRTQNRLEHLSAETRTKRLEPKAMDVLCALATRAGETVSRQELLDSIWSHRLVVEGALTRVIRSLRASLGDDARAPTYIETVTKRGYRLLVAPQPESAAARAPDVACDDSNSAFEQPAIAGLPLIATTQRPRRVRWWGFTAALSLTVTLGWVLLPAPVQTGGEFPSTTSVPVLPDNAGIGAAAATRPARILWVDDKPANNHAEISRLKDMGIVVVTAESNAEATEALRGREYDVLISDMRRKNPEPELAGLALPRQALPDRNRLPPVIYYVGEALAPRTEDGYPVTTEPEELFHLIAELMPQRTDGVHFN